MALKRQLYRSCQDPNLHMALLGVPSVAYHYKIVKISTLLEGKKGMTGLLKIITFFVFSSFKVKQSRYPDFLVLPFVTFYTRYNREFCSKSLKVKKWILGGGSCLMRRCPRMWHKTFLAELNDGCQSPR